MKKVTVLLITILIFINSVVFAEGPSLNAEGAILIDYDSGEILFEKNSHSKLYPASTTKLLTAILAVENSSLSDVVTVDQEVVDLTKGSHIALEPGEMMTMEQMLHALLLPSANDAALAIAKHVGGSVENFIRMMNERAVTLGARDSTFVNPNGLHDERHVSSAHDLAKIGRFAMNNEIIRNIVKKTTYEIPPTNKKTETRYLHTTNKLISSNEIISVDGKSTTALYQGAAGTKTGYTSQAMNCLVSYVEKDGQRLMAVVLKAEGMNVYIDSHKLYNFGFANFKNTVLAKQNEYMGDIPVPNGKIPYVAAIMDRDITYPTMSGATSDIQRRVTPNKDIAAPLSKGAIIGTVEFIKDGEIIGGGHILSTVDIEIDPMTDPMYKILSYWYLIVFALLFLIRLINLRRRKRARIRTKRRKLSYS